MTTPSNTSTDSVLRAMTIDGSFRFIALNASETARGILKAQHITNANDQPEQAHNGRILAELVAGAVMLRQAMSPDYRFQIVLKQEGVGTITADAFPEGMTRGLLQIPDDKTLSFGQETLLTAIRAMPNDALHQGVIETSPEDGVSQALMTYLASSEQVHSVISVGTVWDADGNLQFAGGYLVQLLPNADINTLSAITAELDNSPGIETLLAQTQADPTKLLRALFSKEIDYTLLDQHSIFAGCNCSKGRVISALLTLGPDDLADLFEKESTVSAGCDYCGVSYEVTRDQVITTH